MSSHTLEVAWEQLRPGVTVVRSDGQQERAAIVDRSRGTVVVIFTDGRREQHDPAERAQVVVREV
ncbi:MAG: hypothetical protein ACXVWF_10350 [Actinomycetota bacterium]